MSSRSGKGFSCQHVSCQAAFLPTHGALSEVLSPRLHLEVPGSRALGCWVKHPAPMGLMSCDRSSRFLRITVLSWPQSPGRVCPSSLSLRLCFWDLPLLLTIKEHPLQNCEKLPQLSRRQVREGQSLRALGFPRKRVLGEPPLCWFFRSVPVLPRSCEPRPGPKLGFWDRP